jgi:hypothetical protein
MGYDMEAMKAAFRKDPKAQPLLGQWLEFRRKSVARMYRTIIGAVHKHNPKVDFRLNHWTRAAAKGGMYVEDIVPMLNSVRLMSYHEQDGDPAKLAAKRRWVAETVRLAGGRIPVLAAIGVRDRAYPELIRRGVGVAVSEGVQGITLGHYDAAAFSILRAVRTGLVEAGVKGVPPVRGIEAEDMRLEGFQRHRWAYETCVAARGSATATARFALEPGTYDLKLSYAEQEKGAAELALLIDGRKIDAWRLDGNRACWLVRRMPKVSVKKGDEIRIVAKAGADDPALVDFLEFVRRK